MELTIMPDLEMALLKVPYYDSRKPIIMDTSDDAEMSLHKAVIDGMVDVVEAILSRGEDPNKREEDTGRTVVHCAVQLGSVPMLQLLKNYGADMSKMDYRSNTPLCKAVQEGKVHIVEWLLINLPQNENVIQDMLSIAADSGQVTVMSMLLARGAAIDSKDELGRNPLFFAAEAGQTEAVRYFLQRGANPALLDDFNKTLIHAAAEGGNPKTVDLVLKHCHSKINFRDKSGDTPLHCASNTNKEVVALLVDHGATVDLKNELGYTALDLAKQAKNVEVSNYLREIELCKGIKNL